MAKGKGSAPSVPELNVPSVSDLQNQAISANIESLPKLLAAYQQYGPEFSKTLSDIYIQQQQRAPEAFPDTFRVLQPLSRYVANRIQAADNGLDAIPAPIQSTFTEGLRAAQAARGQAGSPISAVGEGVALSGLAEDYRRNAVNEGINFLGVDVPTMDTTLTPEGLGLQPPSIQSLVDTGMDRAELDLNAKMARYTLEQQKYNKEMEKRMAKFKAIGQIGGAVIGGVGGSFVGQPLAGAQIGASAGAQAGAAAGTFF